MKKPKLEQIDLSPKQALGVFFIALSLFTYMGGLVWVSAYWDHSLVETYRDYEIHFFASPNVYGVKLEGVEPINWPMARSRGSARDLIDSILDEPELQETYRDFELYMIQGYELYYGTSSTENTPKFDTVENLKNYIDQAYYPVVVRTKHRDQGDYLIYRSGLETEGTLVYWVETPDGETSETYETLAEANTAAEALITEYDNHTGSIPDPGTDEPNNSTTPDPPGQVGSEYDPPGETVGDRLNAQKNLISGISATIGIGLVAIDIGAHRDE